VILNKVGAVPDVVKRGVAAEYAAKGGEVVESNRERPGFPLGAQVDRGHQSANQKKNASQKPFQSIADGLIQIPAREAQKRYVQTPSRSTTMGTICPGSTALNKIAL